MCSKFSKLCSFKVLINCKISKTKTKFSYIEYIQKQSSKLPNKLWCKENSTGKFSHFHYILLMIIMWFWDIVGKKVNWANIFTMLIELNIFIYLQYSIYHILLYEPIKCILYKRYILRFCQRKFICIFMRSFWNFL